MAPIPLSRRWRGGSMQRPPRPSLTAARRTCAPTKLLCTGCPRRCWSTPKSSCLRPWRTARRCTWRHRRCCQEASRGVRAGKVRGEGIVWLAAQGALLTVTGSARNAWGHDGQQGAAAQLVECRQRGPWQATLSGRAPRACTRAPSYPPASKRGGPRACTPGHKGGERARLQHGPMLFKRGVSIAAVVSISSGLGPARRSAGVARDGHGGGQGCSPPMHAGERGGRTVLAIGTGFPEEAGLAAERQQTRR
jgi:hypothetical protein